MRRLLAAAAVVALLMAAIPVPAAASDTPMRAWSVVFDYRGSSGYIHILDDQLDDMCTPVWFPWEDPEQYWWEIKHWEDDDSPGVYSILVRLRSNTPTGYECTARWDNACGGTVNKICFEVLHRDRSVVEVENISLNDGSFGRPGGYGGVEEGLDHGCNEVSLPYGLWMWGSMYNPEACPSGYLKVLFNAADCDTADGHRVYTSVSPAGSGTVTVAPQQQTYEPGAEITLTATPKAGWTFSHWMVDDERRDEDGSVIGLVVNANVYATAHFTGLPVAPPAGPTGTITVTVVKADGGAVGGLPVSIGGAVGATVHTDANGQAALTGLWSGTYSVNASAEGYTGDGPKSITLASDSGSGSATLTLTLVAPPPEPPVETPIEDPIDEPGGQPEQPEPQAPETPASPPDLPKTGATGSMAIVGLAAVAAGCAVRRRHK